MKMFAVISNTDEGCQIEGVFGCSSDAEDFAKKLRQENLPSPIFDEELWADAMEYIYKYVEYHGEDFDNPYEGGTPLWEDVETEIRNKTYHLLMLWLYCNGVKSVTKEDVKKQMEYAVYKETLKTNKKYEVKEIDGDNVSINDISIEDLNNEILRK